MVEHERERTGQILPVCEGGYFRTHVRMTCVVVSAWMVIGVHLLCAARPLYAEAGGVVSRLWTAWGIGFIGAWLLYRMRRPNPGNARFASGLLAIIAVLLLTGRTYTLGACVLGASHQLMITSTVDTRWIGIFSAFAAEDEQAKNIRKALCSVSLAALIISQILCMLLKIHHSLTACALAATAVAFALLTLAYHDPIDRRVQTKIQRCLELQNEGKAPDPKVIAWLYDRLIDHKTRAWVMPFLMWVGRTILHYRIEYTDESIREHSSPVVYLANHGNVFGTIANRCNTPGSVRTWVIYYLVEGGKISADYMYTYTFSTKRYIPKPLRKPVSQFMAAVLYHAMRGLDAIPVYRDSPLTLRKTFSESLEALRSGDDILIFPENPNVHGKSSGYETKGVGSFYSGFSILGQMYWAKTGHSCRFVPMYADRVRHVITFGEPVVYDPHNAPASERERIARACEAEMHRLAEIGRS